MSNAPDDPTLELRNSNGELLLGEENWKDDSMQASRIEAAASHRRAIVTRRLSRRSAQALTPPFWPASPVLQGSGSVEVYNLTPDQ